jgi:chain length determinant protein tyrosine kinase EpsG
MNAGMNADMGAVLGAALGAPQPQLPPSQAPPSQVPPSQVPPQPPPLQAVPQAQRPGREASIGDLLGHARSLDAAQVERILAHQRSTGQRFGEAAVALGLVAESDVAQALSHQFRYPYTPAGQGAFSPDLVVASQPFSPHAEAFRGIRAQVRMRLRQAAAGHNAVAVLSPARGDGRSYFAANLAVAFSQLGGRTLLIDADLRHARQHTLFGLGSSGGLAHMLSGRSESLAVEAVPGLPALFVLPAGATPPNPQELLEGPGLARLLNDVRDKFDHIVLDTPAFAHGMDGSVVAAACGAALLVLRPGHSVLAAAQDLAAVATGGGALLAGVVLNARH